MLKVSITKKIFEFDKKKISNRTITENFTFICSFQE